ALPLERAAGVGLVEGDEEPVVLPPPAVEREQVGEVAPARADQGDLVANPVVHAETSPGHGRDPSGPQPGDYSITLARVESLTTRRRISSGLAFLAGVGFAAVPAAGPFVALLAWVGSRFRTERADRLWWVAAL